jgi:3-oxoacyl-[acyl-carrier-protein] synthase-3
MVPESGRFTVGFALLTAVEGEDPESRGDSESRVNASEAPVWPRSHGSLRSRFALEIDPVKALEASPLADAALDGRDELTRTLVLELSLVWAEFERMLRATPVIQRLENGTLTVEDYKRLLVNLRQQVMEGARWIARAASNVAIDRFPMRSAFLEHAADEHKDYQMIERDYCALGGTMEEMTSTPKNVGSEALSSFLFHHASQPDPVDLLGAMFVIEGLGKRKAAEWAAQIRKALRLRDDPVRFLCTTAGTTTCTSRSCDRAEGFDPLFPGERRRDRDRPDVFETMLADPVLPVDKERSSLLLVQRYRRSGGPRVGRGGPQEALLATVAGRVKGPRR